METVRTARARLIESPSGDLGELMNLCAYATVAIGYLSSVLTASRLTLPAFVLFTALNVAWVAAFRLLTSDRCAEDWERPLMLALVALALGTQLTLWVGLGFDWLLPVVTASILALGRPWRPALASTAAIFVLSFVTVALPRGGLPISLSAFLRQGFNNALSLVPVYMFVAIFSLVLRRQALLRQRAEALAAEVSRSTHDLEQANIQLRRFAQQVEELAVTQERNRLAREIHDTLGHYLTILAVKLETATHLESRGDPRLRAELAEARRLASECLTEVRHSVAALRPADQTTTTLKDGLRRLAGEFESAAPDLAVTLDLEDSTTDPPPDVRLALYRCAQEALTNIRKHAHASKVLVRLRADAGAAELTVLDNGFGGIAPEHADDMVAGGFGLIGMRERMALLGGSVAAGPEPRGGWRVEVRVPHDPRQGGPPDATPTTGAATLPVEA